MKTYISIIACFICVKAFTQNLSDYAFYSGLEISGMAIKDNFLYFGAYDNDYIRKIDLTQPPTQTSTLVVDGISGVKDLMFIGNDLYIAQFNGSKIKMVDVTSSNPVIETVVENVSAASSILLHNGYLYIAEAYGHKVSRIDLSQTNPVPETVVDYANGPWRIQVHNDVLYIAETYDDLISKFDLSDPNASKENIMTNISNGPWGIVVKDDFLYYENNTNLLRIDLTESPQNSYDCDLPYWSSNGILEFALITEDNIMYRKHSNGILKYNLDNLLSVNEDVLKPEISLVPNPASHFIKINNLNEKAHIKICNSLGQIVEEKYINGEEPINIEMLKSGLYFLSIDNEHTFKFVKE